MQKELLSISPIDGRYKGKVTNLSNYFSEFALIKYRVFVEIEYFKALNKLNEIPFSYSDEALKILDAIYTNFSLSDAESVKEIERTTNHDVKAVEYFIKEKLAGTEFEPNLEWIHFGLTSQDINNTANPIMLREFLQNEFYPQIEQVLAILETQAQEWQKQPLLARTHGQAASPTTLGKEWQVFIKRINAQISHLKNIKIYGKFGGATGNMNAHFVAFPNVDWHQFAQDFLNTQLKIERYFPTTQIEHYDMLSAIFDAVKRINTILIDFCRDVWTYVSMDYFKQKIKEGEVGSSAMPHKVNPIDFENAEGNLGIANALLNHLSEKLPISRLQRDLTDSTVSRNIGVPFAHCIISLKSIEKGLNKLLLNEEKINNDLDNNWAVVAEAIQTILRRENYPKPYEALKGLTRTNAKITEETIKSFVENLQVSEQIKQELRQISPFNYIGK